MNSNELSVVGKSVVRKDAREKVTGKAEFSIDLKLKFPRLLYAKIVRSSQPHAKILNIDVSKALKLPGVYKVLTSKDYPQKLTGFGFFDEPLFAWDKVCYYGEPVAAVVARDPFIAEEARSLVEVEYEPLPYVLDPEEAAQPNPKVVIHDANQYEDHAVFANMIRYKDRPNIYNHRKLRLGDVDDGFKKADIIVENVYNTPLAAHCGMEPHSAIAVKQSDGSIEIWSGAQATFAARGLIALYLGLPATKVRHHTLYVGGGFGNKITPKDNFMAAALATRLDRPVSVEYDRSEVFYGTVVRHPFKMYVKDGVTKDGKWVASEMTAYMSGGAYSDLGWLVTRNTVYAFGGYYWIPNVKLDAYGTYTNHTPAASFRGFGSAQLEWAIEQQADILAEKLGMDPAKFRKMNMHKPDGENVLGEKVESFGAPECLDKVVDAIGWGKKPASEDLGVWKRGIGFALGNKYGVAPNISTATVKALPDGSFDVRMSADELGQGIRTGIAQLAAEELGVPIEKINIIPIDTSISPYDMGSYSSRSMFSTGNAVLLACKDAKRQILELVGKKLKLAPEELDMKNGEILVKSDASKRLNMMDAFSVSTLDGNRFPDSGEILGKSSFFYLPNVEDPETGRSTVPGGRLTSFYMITAQAAEVDVNTQTGQVKVNKLYIATDCGKAINPKIVETQQEDAAQMGIGLSTLEELVLKDGMMVNPNFRDYKMVTSCEAPTIENVKVFIVEAPHPAGPFGAKGTGEVTVNATGPAIANAIYNAVGVRIKDAPATAERVWRALKEKRKP